MKRYDIKQSRKGWTVENTDTGQVYWVSYRAMPRDTNLDARFNGAAFYKDVLIGISTGSFCVTHREDVRIVRSGW